MHIQRPRGTTGCPLLGGRVTFPPPPTREDRQVHVTAIVAPRQEGKFPITFLVGALSNKDRRDGKTLGAASAALYFAGKEWGHAEWQYGETLAKHGVGIGAL